ncbi:hypothetical protein [Phenylobacterium sp.]|jgi:hypothetical protein|uniref:hypothetical protein n=1 Tax=Phenylobacterium sp. TaxID=1871053 RepID=UPI002F40AE66
MKLACLAAVALLGLSAGATRASGLFDAFHQACMSGDSDVAAVAAATQAPGWAPIDPASFPVIAIPSGGTIPPAPSPAAIARAKATRDGRVQLFADQQTQPRPGQTPLKIHSCLVRIERADPDALKQVRAWLGPDVSAAGSGNEKATIFTLLPDGAGFRLPPASFTVETLLRLRNLFVLMDDGPKPQTSILYVFKGD